MVLFKPIKGKIKNPNIEIETETGHIIKYKIIPEILLDIDNQEEPFFSVGFTNEYKGVENLKTSLSLKEIKAKYLNSNILGEREFDHIQIGFVYAEGDPNNHRWMLNFMDVNNKYLFGYYADNIKINCPFSTLSWQDGIWHGRFIINKKDLEELLELKEGYFILQSNTNIGEQQVQEIKEKYDSLSLAYNIQTNNWYCNYLLNEKVIGSIPCKNIICDVPFEGKVDKSSSKPKVTAILKKEDIKGISVALNALIIKRK